MQSEATVQQTSKSFRHEKPYVGLRPYEREEQDLFFGRDRDARFLSDKIFSARLTLLYSQSGLGKSSLLRTLVIPRLEDEHARVIYFDAWTGEEPTALLKDALVECADELGIPDAGAGAPTLIDLVRLLLSVDDKTLVLVLDQFEEFLISHGQRLDPLRKELAKVVRISGLDVHVVISLRQEFLAALEPFRHEILNLFQSTYKLESLNDEEVRDAIQLPAQEFDTTYEPELVDVLLKDLRGEGEGVSSGETGAGAALPILQLVCSELWEAKKDDDSTITLDLYKEELGGLSKILDAYVRKVMPRHRRDQRLTARLMQFLAPPSGLKMSYSVEDLVPITRIKKDPIAAELKRLSQLRILRTRKFGSSERYELQHDAFIKVVTPWRDKIIKGIDRLKKIRWTFTFFCIILLFFAGILVSNIIEDNRELSQNTRGAFAEYRKSANIPIESGFENIIPEETKFDYKRPIESMLDDAASYLLWRRHGPERLVLLRDLLQNNRDLIPSWYGINTSGIDFLSLTDDKKWPLKLYFSPSRDLDRFYFNLTWQTMAKFLAEKWCIPVPRQIMLEKKTILPKRDLVLTNPQLKKNEASDIEFKLETYEDYAFISSKGLSGPANEFFNRFRSNWIPLVEIKRGGPWWVVPRWSLPVWKVSGLPAYSGSGYPAFRLALHLQKNPELLLPPQAVNFLLERISRSYPQTVAEARSARGYLLRQDLIERVRLGYSLTDLPMFLDALARYPKEEPPEDVANWASQDVNSSVASLPVKLHGPWMARGNNEMATGNNGKPTDRIHKAYRDVETWLPKEEPLIRVYIGKSLESEFSPKGVLSPQLMERIRKLRSELYCRFGIKLPAIKFRDYSWDKDLGDREIRIEMLNQNKENLDAKPIVIDPGAAVDQLIDYLRFRAEGLRIYWVNAETVYRDLKGFDPALQRWIREHYSLTDIKLLLRAVINPSADEQDKRNNAADGDNIEISSEYSIRYREWLLRSLVFWSLVDNPTHSVKLMAKRLRSTQKARLNPGTTADVRKTVTKAIDQGLDALDANQPGEAETAFSRAIQVDRSAAVQSFLNSYPRRLYKTVRLDLEKACKNPTSASLSQDQLLILEELFEESPGDIGTKEARGLKLCLLKNYPEYYPLKRQKLMEELLYDCGNPDEWPADEAAFLAQTVLNDYDPLKHDSMLLDRARAFLMRAVGEFDDRQIYQVFRDLLNVCQKPGPKNWCWKLMDEIANLRPKSNMALEYAYQLSSREKQADLKNALYWVELSKEYIKNIRQSPEERKRKLDFVHFSQALALRNLTNLAHGNHYTEAEQLLRTLLNSREFGESSHFILANIMIEQNCMEKADKILKTALDKWPKNAYFYSTKLWIDFLEGNISGAADTASMVIEKAGRSEDTLLIAALGLILTESKGWEHTGREFIETDHRYVDLVTMMLCATLSGKEKDEAKKLLDRRWADIDKETWSARIRGGDNKAWHEMLLGYYIGKIEKNRIFDVLDDETAFDKSDFKYLSISRKGMLTEAYFYDAILAQAEGNLSRMRASLEKVLNINYRCYTEYIMAKFLLAHKDSLWK